MLSATTLLIIVISYFSLLLLISYYTSRKADTASFFVGNKQSAWYLVALGMVGDSLSGVTFVSVPGKVGVINFAYLQLVAGFVLGYFVIAYVLLPIYYKMNLTSIYEYLRDRLGSIAQKTGAGFFILSRMIGAAFRLYIAAGVLQLFIFQPLGVPFAVTVAMIIVLIILYTIRGGIKTLVYTDVVQSLFLLIGVISAIVAVCNGLDWDFVDASTAIMESKYSSIIQTDWMKPNHFLKQILAGALISISMTGLDQNMMQKNLSCKSLAEAQKNIISFGMVQFFINLLFVSLGALLYLYAQNKGIEIPKKTDELFPMLALNHFGILAAITFLVGISAATFSSADSVLTSLTTSFYIDILDSKYKNNAVQERSFLSIAQWAFGGVLFLLIITFSGSDEAVVKQVFTIAGYTYGPLIGLFFFGIFTKRSIEKDKQPAILFISLIAPAICYFLKMYLKEAYQYEIGDELLFINAALVFSGLYSLSTNEPLKLTTH